MVDGLGEVRINPYKLKGIKQETIHSGFVIIPAVSTQDYTDYLMTAEDQNLSSGIAAFEAKHFNTAYPLLKPLAEAGNTEALYRMAIMCQNGLGMVANEQKAFEYMKQAAEQGHPLAQHGLGFMYMQGECVEQDGREAERWFLQAADQGMTGSLTTLALMYKDGTGVEKDEKKANELLQKAGFDPKDF